jgi:phage terminase small subunit
MTEPNKAPSHLQPATKRWFLDVLDAYQLEDHHVKLLTLAAEAWDRCAQARKAIGKLGITYVDSKGSPHARPEIRIERDSRLSFVRLLRELDLDVDLPAEASRPPALKSNRRLHVA